MGLLVSNLSMNLIRVICINCIMQYTEVPVIFAIYMFVFISCTLGAPFNFNEWMKITEMNAKAVVISVTAPRLPCSSFSHSIHPLSLTGAAGGCMCALIVIWALSTARHVSPFDSKQGPLQSGRMRHYPAHFLLLIHYAPCPIPNHFLSCCPNLLNSAYALPNIHYKVKTQGYDLKSDWITLYIQIHLESGVGVTSGSEMWCLIWGSSEWQGNRVIIRGDWQLLWGN